jgi:TonB-linked SusC/RagA family outer membrane protein
MMKHLILFVKNKKLFLLLLLTVMYVSDSFAQSTITGIIKDNTGETLPSVSVLIKGTTNGTVSDINGKYSIKATKGTVLIFKYVGFNDQQITVGDNTVINVTLQPNNKELNEVVVIGYGTQKRSNVTGATASLRADNLDERPITRVDQALVGQLAGVTVKQNTGLPGKAFSVQVRGTGSISAGNEPLYVIDGFPLANNSTNTGNGSFVGGNPLDNINPDDIEDIQVLKDAAAAAIYGSRASNGVVLITTKRGKTGKPKITFSNSVGYNEASKKLQMLNGDQWIARATEMINAAYVAKFGANGATASDNAATRTAMNGGAFSTAYQLDPRWAIPGHPGLEYVDWQSAIERKGLMENHEVSASGGTESVSYYMSGGYQNQQGFITGVGYKQYSVRANLDINVSKNLKMGINVSPSYSITEDPGVEGKDNIFHQALSMSPIQEDSVGLLANTGKNAQYLWSNTTNSPVGKLMYNVGESKRYRTLATVYGDYQIIKGLNLRSSLNLDNVDNTSRTYVPYLTTGSQLSRTFNAQTNPNLFSATSGSLSSYRHQTFVNENTLTYNTTINSVHSLNVLVGQSYNLDRLDQTGISSVGGYSSGNIQTINAASAVALNGTNGSSQSVLVSYFSRVQYGYKEKYLLSASLRSDGSSRFGTNNQYGIFPSLSIGWKVSEEGFMKSLPAVSDLKLRASYGVNGNNNIGNYSSIPTLGTYGYVFGATQTTANGQAPNVIANPNLQWEKSQTYDGGFDFGFLNNRIIGSFDYYNKLSTKLLLNVQTLEVTGFSSAIDNIGSVRNIGQELELTTRNFIGKFQWNTTINISHNTNKVVSLANGQSQIIIPNGFDVTDQIIRVGQPLNSIYVVRQTGILSAADIANHAAMFNNESVGDPKYEDVNGDGLITEADKQIVGHANPDYTWGVTNTFHYKGFDLSVLIQGQNGGSVYSLLGRAITRTGQGFTDNAPYFYADRWTSPDNPGAGRVSKAYSTFGFIANTDWLYSSDYVRVKDITLGYNLKSLIKAPLVQGARIYVTAENFFGHDKYYGGLNPDAANTTISSNSSYPEAGDYGGLPLARSLIFGLNFTF